MMADEDKPQLTERQIAVLEGIDRRLPLKAVAAELGISESRVNQHVRALKEIYGVASLGELVEAWRGEASRTAVSASNQTNSLSDEPYRNSAWRNSQVPKSDDGLDQGSWVAPGEFVLSDAAPIAIEAPWKKHEEPQVVPGVLDGDNAVLIRLAVIIGIAFGIVAAVVLMVTATLSLSEALKGIVVTPSKVSASAD
ncbi:LuxR C-terminal-related transcriptional regulator [Tsuneonella flava]|uniref:LuxR C-terminal-related transcriptional regulator n=1 Tax=Tsuneonella flava TaxID=2055955 RepID=UPI001F2F1C8C|nr:hypothetical protein [Tsuneonella flava]